MAIVKGNDKFQHHRFCRRRRRGRAVQFARLAPGLWLTYTDFSVEWIIPAG